MKLFHIRCTVWMLLTFTYTLTGFGQSSINVGEVFNETLKFTDPGNSAATLKIPNDSCILLYRYRGNNWLMDTQDSIAKVEEIIQDLQKNNYFGNLVVVCYSYNRDKYLNLSNKPNFKPSNLYRFRNYFLSEKNPRRLLSGGKLVLINKKGKVLAYSQYVAGFKFMYVEQTTRLVAKLFTEKEGKTMPLVDAVVVVEADKVLSKPAVTRTNKFGDFEITVPESMDTGMLRITAADTSIRTVIIANRYGIEQTRVNGTSGKFEYKLIEADFFRLSESDLQEDLSLSFNTFLASGDKEFKRNEFINYEVGMYHMDDMSKVVLENIAALLAENPSISMEVISHTDSQGDDKSNMELSEKRSLNVMSYLILIGVHKDRLSYTGKGETEIRNRCKNGVDCSPAEHRYNRRTEFRFYKK